MISKISKGGSFAGAVSYVSEKDGAQLLSTNCASADPREIAREMQTVAEMNTKCTKPVLHVSLSAAPSERLSDDRWRGVAQDYMRKMGIDSDRHQYLLVRHTDRDHDHVHLIVNRVNAQDLQVVSDSNDRRRSMSACREIEKERGLQNGNSKHDEKHSGLKTAIKDSIKASRGDFSRFVTELDKRGVSVKLNQSQTTGHISGISYQQSGGPLVKGSSIGYSYNSLDAHLQRSAARTMASKQMSRIRARAAGKAKAGKVQGKKTENKAQTSGQLGKQTSQQMQSDATSLIKELIKTMQMSRQIAM